MVTIQRHTDKIMQSSAWIFPSFMKAVHEWRSGYWTPPITKQKQNEYDQSIFIIWWVTSRMRLIARPNKVRSFFVHGLYLVSITVHEIPSTAKKVRIFRGPLSCETMQCRIEQLPEVNTIHLHTTARYTAGTFGHLHAFSKSRGTTSR